MSKGKKSDKIKVGITIGDVNGISPEVILKTFSDERMLQLCSVIIYGSSKTINFYKKVLELDDFNYQIAKYINNELQINPNVVNIVNCWDDIVEIKIGESTEDAGKYALIAIDDAIHDLDKGMIDVLVTAPINKSNIQLKDDKFTGHTEYITKKTGAEESVMLMVGEQIKVGLVTNHLPIKEVPVALTTDLILKKIEILSETLIKDFAIEKPRIAVFGLNPHAGDEGLLGEEETEIIIPAIKKAKEIGHMAFGPYAADGFMGSSSFKHFDAILAMYHDQGMVAFKTINFGSGVNYTAGLNIIRTSPDHGTAYDIAGKGEANETSLRKAVFLALDIARNRAKFNESTSNPLKHRVLSEIEK